MRNKVIDEVLETNAQLFQPARYRQHEGRGTSCKDTRA